VTTSPTSARIDVADEVAAAIADRRPVVALDSLLLAHGLPRPRNRVLAEETEQRIREGGAVPATIGVLDGQVRVGVDAEGLARLADGGERMPALAWPDVPFALARGGDGALSPGAAAMAASLAGVPVLATVGIVGARPGDAGDGDVTALVQASVTVVCGGVLPPADTEHTLGRARAVGVSVVGLGTDHVPDTLYRNADTDPLEWSVEDAAEAARLVRARQELLPSAAAGIFVVATPADAALPARLLDRLVRAGESAAERRGLGDVALPPAVVHHVHASSGLRAIGVHTAVSDASVSAATALAVALRTR
jgi:pseudouridylate synthase